MKAEHLESAISDSLKSDQSSRCAVIKTVEWSTGILIHFFERAVFDERKNKPREKYMNPTAMDE